MTECTYDPNDKWLHDEITFLLASYVKKFDECRFEDEDEDMRTTRLSLAVALKDKILETFIEHNIYELAPDELFAQRSRYLKEQRKIKARFEKEIREFKIKFEKDESDY